MYHVLLLPTKLSNPDEKLKSIINYKQYIMPNISAGLPIR